MISIILLFAGIITLCTGFRPEITRLQASVDVYVAKNKVKEEKQIASTKGEVISGTVEQTANAVAKGIKQSDTVICKNCDAQIDNDSKF